MWRSALQSSKHLLTGLKVRRKHCNGDSRRDEVWWRHIILALSLFLCVLGAVSSPWKDAQLQRRWPPVNRRQQVDFCFEHTFPYIQAVRICIPSASSYNSQQFLVFNMNVGLPDVITTSCFKNSLLHYSHDWYKHSSQQEKKEISSFLKPEITWIIS
jgi:hypothetical protein